MRRSVALSFALLLAALMAGCGRSDDASMPIRGNDISLSVIREKSYFWSDGWDLSFVMSRMPDCTRRHHVKHVGDGDFLVDVYDAGNGGWILNQGYRWYVADTASCELQQFDDKPPFPGTLVGSFVAGDGQELTFKAVPTPAPDAAAPQPADASSPAAPSQ